MRCYIDGKKFVFEITKRKKRVLRVAIRTFEAAIKHASNLSDDDKKSELAKYIANNFLDDESKKIAASSYWNFIYMLKDFLAMN